MPSVYFSPAFNEATLNASGTPAVGYKLYTYDAGTTTPRATYTDQTGGSAQTNPIILDARGEPPSPIWLLSGETKFILKTAADVPVRTVDDVTGVGTLASQNISLGGFGLTNVGVLTGGTDTAETVNGISPSWQRNGTTLATAGLGQLMWSADAVGANFVFAKSRGAAIGTDTIVQSGDDLGSITAYGSNGTTFDPAARILFEVGGTPGATTDMPGAIVFYTCPDGSVTLTESLRITASGELTFTRGNLTWNGLAFSLTSAASATTASILNTSSTGNGSTFTPLTLTGGGVSDSTGTIRLATGNTVGDPFLISFYTDASTLRGSVTYNRGGGVIAYNTTSDYRLKDIYGDLEGASETLGSLKVYLGKMKEGTIERPMMVAHEAQEIAPYAVTGEKDAVDDEGNPQYQMMDHQILVPLLIAGWQEHERVIAVLLARIEALEAK